MYHLPPFVRIAPFSRPLLSQSIVHPRSNRKVTKKRNRRARGRWRERARAIIIPVWGIFLPFFVASHIYSRMVLLREVICVFFSGQPFSSLPLFLSLFYCYLFFFFLWGSMGPFEEESNVRLFFPLFSRSSFLFFAIVPTYRFHSRAHSLCKRC